MAGSNSIGQIDGDSFAGNFSLEAVEISLGAAEGDLVGHPYETRKSTSYKSWQISGGLILQVGAGEGVFGAEKLLWRALAADLRREQVFRIEYVDPDGSIHPILFWERDTDDEDNSSSANPSHNDTATSKSGREVW